MPKDLSYLWQTAKTENNNPYWFQTGQLPIFIDILNNVNHFFLLAALWSYLQQHKINCSKQMCTLRSISMDFQTSSGTATAPSVQQEKELPLLRTGLVYRTKIYISDIGMWSCIGVRGPDRRGGVDLMVICNIINDKCL